MMRIMLMALLMAFTISVQATPITLGDITGNSAHTETDSGDELFRLTDLAVGQNDATAFLLFEYAGYAGVNTFGIYDGSTMLEVFNGGATAITSATLSWDTGSDTVTNLTSGASAVIDELSFGFYLESGDGNTYFSESALNGGLDMMLSFDTTAAGHADLFGSDYVLAWEDLSIGSDWDYNDLVVGISDVAAIPEPSALALMFGGLGLLGMAGYKRKNS